MKGDQGKWRSVDKLKRALSSMVEVERKAVERRALTLIHADKNITTHTSLTFYLT